MVQKRSLPTCSELLFVLLLCLSSSPLDETSGGKQRWGKSYIRNFGVSRKEAHLSPGGTVKMQYYFVCQAQFLLLLLSI